MGVVLETVADFDHEYEEMIGIPGNEPVNPEAFRKAWLLIRAASSTESPIDQAELNEEIGAVYEGIVPYQDAVRLGMITVSR